MIAFLFDKIVLLATNEGLVDFTGAIFDDTIEHNLVAEREDEFVARFDVFRHNLGDFTIYDEFGALLGEELKLVDNFFGAGFVDDANQGVLDGDEDKKDVFVRANKNNHRR